METMIKLDPKEIMTRLVRIQTDMNFVREHIEGIILTEDDLLAIKEAKNDLKKGKTRRL